MGKRERELYEDFMRARAGLRKQDISEFIHETRYLILFYVFGDWISTIYALEYGYELNVLLRFVIERYGAFYIIFLKFFILALLFFEYRAIKKYPAFWNFTRWTVTAIGVLACVGNTLVIILGKSGYAP